MKIELQVKPLSVNKVWQGRRFKTQDYVDYESSCLWLLNKVKPVKGEVEIHYKFHFKGRMMDVDNPIKPLQDVLVKAGIIEDDRKIMKITAEKFKAREDSIEIEIKHIK